MQSSEGFGARAELQVDGTRSVGCRPFFPSRSATRLRVECRDCFFERKEWDSRVRHTIHVLGEVHQLARESETNEPVTILAVSSVVFVAVAIKLDLLLEHSLEGLLVVEMGQSLGVHVGAGGSIHVHHACTW